jgi:predicted amidohydrolase YtcJ
MHSLIRLLIHPPAAAVVLLLCLVANGKCHAMTSAHASAADAAFDASLSATDTLFVNARFHLVDEGWTTAEALLVRDGRVVAAGMWRDLEASAQGAAVVDLGGGHVYPGFIDAHAHLFGLGQEALILSLHQLRSIAEVTALVRTRAVETPAGGWIQGRGWDQNLWEGKSWPTRGDLDAACTTHPVYLRRVDGHAAWCNSLALARAGITRETPDPAGGRILRDAAGEPTGVLVDNAADLVRGVIPPTTAAEFDTAYRHAVRTCLSKGMTGMHDMGLLAPSITALRSLIARGEFPFRVVGYIDGRGDDWEELLSRGRVVEGDDRLVLAGLKLYADGALGSRGALLFDDYADDAGNRGLQLCERDTIVYEARRALARGLQVCVHAIGDAGNALALDAFEQARNQDARAVREDLRTRIDFRIEHVQVLRAEDVPRFVRAGVIASMQPVHCTSDMRWAERRLGAERVRHAYAWRSLLDAGAWIAGGSDFPIERPDPIAGIHAACTRRDAAGLPSSQADIDRDFHLAAGAVPSAERHADGWYGAQRMTRREAVLAFTRWAARAAGMEDRVGSLEPGRWADFVVLDRDLLTVPDAELPGTRVRATWSAGREVWRADGD